MAALATALTCGRARSRRLRTERLGRRVASLTERRYLLRCSTFLIAVHVAGGLLLKVGSVAWSSDRPGGNGCPGLVLAGAVLLASRPRLQVGSAGLSVRNPLLTVVGWSEVIGVQFPAVAGGRRSTADDEVHPVTIKPVNKDRAVAAMDLRALVLARPAEPVRPLKLPGTIAK